ncbi:type 3 dihydrofolate reductase [Chitinophaga japonensis]|uniref:Dihydrofolate reductase n=1 Tax=Chitinophaga japonensis TaxID=104662 RepID=A0A562T5H9_CHIJA|nr:type 3 dihydrofolate reductase [Chitinophaga japonensis]TWI88623.1 dihydrofolate reductase [Chitinophaga japonensis]
MIVSIIVAASENNVIGRDNQLPWHLPADLKYFKQTTLGKPIIMGRKTFESLGKPLPGRPNIVVTRQPGYARDGIIVTPSLRAAITAAGTFGTEEIFVTGGAEIFKQAIPLLVQRIYLTRIHAVVEGDTFFPVFDKVQWELVSSEEHPADEKHEYAFTFEVYERKK